MATLSPPRICVQRQECNAKQHIVAKLLSVDTGSLLSDEAVQQPQWVWFSRENDYSSAIIKLHDASQHAAKT